MNLYSQEQFPNMDLAVTFHIGLCLRIPRSERQQLSALPVEPFTEAYRYLEEAQEALRQAMTRMQLQLHGRMSSKTIAPSNPRSNTRLHRSSVLLTRRQFGPPRATNAGGMERGVSFPGTPEMLAATAATRYAMTKDHCASLGRAATAGERSPSVYQRDHSPSELAYPSNQACDEPKIIAPVAWYEPVPTPEGPG